MRYFTVFRLNLAVEKLTLCCWRSCYRIQLNCDLLFFRMKHGYTGFLFNIRSDRLTSDRLDNDTTIQINRYDTILLDSFKCCIGQNRVN